MPRETLETREVRAEELVSEELALDVSYYRPFRAPYEGVKEPLFSYMLARVRLRNVLVGTLLPAPLLIDTPHGLGLVWQVIATNVRVVLGQESGRQIVFQEVLTTLSLEEYAQSTLRLDCIITTLPSWRR